MLQTFISINGNSASVQLDHEAVEDAYKYGVSLLSVPSSWRWGPLISQNIDITQMQKHKV